MRMNRIIKPFEWRPKAVSHTITNITSPNYCSFINNLIFRAIENDELSVIARIVKNNGRKINGVLRFSIMWNDLDSWDENDLDIRDKNDFDSLDENDFDNWDKNDLEAHCIQPNVFEIYYANKTDISTTGELDVDIINPIKGEAAVENITWMNRNKMSKGTYIFFVHQYSYRKGHSEFRAEIAFDRQVYKYDYRKIIKDGADVHVAEVTLQNDGLFSINHMLPYKRKLPF